jgi:hypothetical protein
MTAAIYEGHLKSLTHAKKVEKAESSASYPVQCSLCSVPLVHAASYQLHTEGKKHCRAMARLGLTTDPGPEEAGLETLALSKQCDVCQSSVPSEVWGLHLNGLRHRRAAAFVSLRRALDESEKDKNGIVITGVESDLEVDYGLLEYSAAGVCGTKTITVMNSNATPIDFVEVRISSRQTTRASLS